MNANVQLIVSVIIALVPSVVSMIALFKIRELHILVNSRLTELLKSTRAEGVSEGERNSR